MGPVACVVDVDGANLVGGQHRPVTLIRRYGNRGGPFRALTMSLIGKREKPAHRTCSILSRHRTGACAMFSRTWKILDINNPPGRRPAALLRPLRVWHGHASQVYASPNTRVPITGAFERLRALPSCLDSVVPGLHGHCRRPLFQGVPIPFAVLPFGNKPSCAHTEKV